MEDKAKRSVSWRSLSAEGVVIVASILVAFSIEAWWDSRGDALQSQALITALSEDFAAAESDLQRVRAWHERKSNSAAQLLLWAESEGVGENQTDQVEIAISEMFIHATFDPPMGTIRTILGSGRLDLLSNPELVRELMRWSSVVDDLREDEETANRHLYQNLLPFLSPRLNLKDLDKPASGIVSTHLWPGERAQTEAHRLLSNPEFQSNVYMVWSLQKSVANDLAPVEVAIERIKRLVEQELTR